MAYNGLPNGVQATHRHNDSALYVGNGKEEAARMRIKDLEEENHILAQKAADASQHYANYENQIRVLQTQLHQQRHDAARLAVEQEQPPERPLGLARLGSFMRKPSLAPTTTPSHDSSAREQELEASLAKEQKARSEAEKKVKVVNAEIEELSATLFQQANDMVAAERKDNAALKDKIRELEKGGGSVSEGLRKENDRLKQKLHTLEQREVERKRRLDRLEAAQKRIDRVRTMLRPP